MYKNAVDKLYCQNCSLYSFWLDIFNNWPRWNKISGKDHLPSITTSCHYNASSVVSNVFYLVNDFIDRSRDKFIFLINQNMLNATFMPFRLNA